MPYKLRVNAGNRAGPNWADHKCAERWEARLIGEYELR